MGRILFFWIFILVSSGFLSQISHFSEHRRSDLAEGLVCVNHKSYYIERINFPFIGTMNLVGVNEMGQVFLRKPLLNGDSYPFPGWIELKKTLDNHMICIYRASGSCDVLGGPIYFSKLDTNGNFKFTATLPWMTGDVLQYSDSSYYLISGANMRHYSKNGSLISNYTFPGTLFSSVSQLNNGNLFLSSSTAFCEIDTAGNYLQIIPTNHNLKRLVQLNNGNCVALNSANKLLFMNQAFAILHQSQFNGVLLNDFVIRNDSLFTVGNYTNNSTPFYCITDTLFNVLYQSSNSLSGLVPSAFALSNSNLINVSAMANGASTTRSRAFFRFPIGGDFMLDQDVGIDTIEIISLNYQFANLFKAEFEVKVRNHSNQPTQGFNLNADLSFGVCPYSWQRWYDTLIPAGGTVKVNTGTLNLTGYISGQNANLCLYTSTPDSQVDFNRNNDSYCMNVIVTSLDENRFQKQNCTVFPNPFTTSFAFLSEFVISEVKVFNALGEVVLSQTATGKEGSIDMHNFKEGIYFVSVETEKGTVTKKLMKQ